MNANYIGIGLQYALNVQGGSCVLVTGPPVIDQSIRTILTTPLGSVFFDRKKGSRVKEILFKVINDSVLKNLLHMVIKDAIDQQEKRVKFVDIAFTELRRNGGILYVLYRTLDSNELQEVVFPFNRPTT